jgi:REP element-mobilizing transposase RayT
MREPQRRHRKRARPAQHELPFEKKTWGGKRPGAGRPPLARRKGVPHRTRPEHKARHPVHVTMRARKRLPSFRRQLVFLTIRRALGETSRRGFRLIHFSVQSDHLHLVVEAHDKLGLSRGISGLTIRVARAVNRLLARRGGVFGDRYHARALRTPQEVRNGIVYVLQNWRKHVPESKGLDPCSSAWWFTGWAVPPNAGKPPGWDDSDPLPIRLPRTWLAETGWRLRGLVRLEERPKPS